MGVGIGIDINNFNSDLVANVDVVNIENPLYPGYLYHNYNNKPDIEFNEEVIVDGAYIDINPAVSEPDIRSIVKKRIIQSIDFATYYRATEVIFLSTYIPNIKVDFYDKGWLKNSVAFWKEVCFKRKDIRISLCNTFEEEPDILLELVKEVDCSNFGLAFDLGHALIYSKIGIDNWYSKVKDNIRTIYIHSNNKIGDEHLSLDEGLLLKDNGFNNIKNDIVNKNVILKLFNKEKFSESLHIIKDF